MAWQGQATMMQEAGGFFPVFSLAICSAVGIFHCSCVSLEVFVARKFAQQIVPHTRDRYALGQEPFLAPDLMVKHGKTPWFRVRVFPSSHGSSPFPRCCTTTWSSAAKSSRSSFWPAGAGCCIWRGGRRPTSSRQRCARYGTGGPPYSLSLGTGDMGRCRPWASLKQSRVYLDLV